MDINANSAFFESANRISGMILKILNSTDELCEFIDREKAKLIRIDACEEALRYLDNFRRDITSADIAARQLFETLSSPFSFAREINNICSTINGELNRACGIFSEVCSILGDDTVLGRNEDLRPMLTSRMIQLDELRSMLDKYQREAYEVAVQNESNLDCQGSWADAPNGYFGGYDSDACPCPGGGWADDSCQSSYGGWGESYAERDSCPMPEPPVAAAPVPDMECMPCMPAAPSVSERQIKPKKVKPIRVDSVSFSVLSPERVKAGEYSSVDVYMYTKSQRKIIDKAIKAAKSAVKETEKSGFSVSRGTEVSVILTSDDVKITDEVDTRTWDGECCQFDFQFFVPEEYKKKQIAFTCQVLFGGIQITRLHFTVGLSAGGARVPVRVKRKDCRKAFVSYSHKDEQRVLKQLAAIVEVAPRMVFWLDSQSMENGDVWRKEIRRAIRNADVFLLFWSIYSSKSSEVEKEWRYAKKKRGIRFILPVPLDAPSECPPPEELGRHLHFGHRSLAHTEEMNGLTFASSKQFRKIK